MIDDRPGILVVDDLPENQVALVTALADLGAEVVAVGSGNEALRRMLARRFSVVLLDVQMPEMDGFEVAELMRGQEALSTTPIVFVTALDRNERLALRGYASGAVDYISKPIDPDILRSKVSVFLALHQASLDLVAMERERLAARNLEALGVLAAGLAHDFNNLLAAIMTNVSLTRPAEGLAAGDTDPRDDALEACHRARDLARQLLGLAPGFIAPPAGADLGAILEPALAPLRHARGVSLAVTLPPRLPLVALDRDQLIRVLENLAQNAAEAMPHGGHCAVTVELVEAASQIAPVVDGGRCVGLRLEDSGPGIPAEVLARVFEPYFTTKPASSVKGTGLGLTVCQSILRKAGGAIRIDSEVGRGTTVQLHLPVATGPATAGT